MTRQWYSVSFNSQNEDGERIMLPRKSRWGGWKFNHPGNLLEFSRGIAHAFSDKEYSRSWEVA